MLINELDIMKTRTCPAVGARLQFFIKSQRL